MSFEPRVSDVLTTEENRSHYHGKPWKWEGKCLHATPVPFPAHPLISPSRSALTVTRVLLPEINGHCASAGVIESPACGKGSGERSAFLLPPAPASQEGQVPNSLWHRAQQPAESRKQVHCTYDHRDPARLRVSLHLRSPGSGVGEHCRDAGPTRHRGKIHPLKIVAASAIATQVGLRTNMHITDFGVHSVCSISCLGDVHPKVNPLRSPKDKAVRSKQQEVCLRRAPQL